MVELVSPFTVADPSMNGDFTETDYDQYVIWSKEELDRDDPGLSSTKYDEAHANLICDIFVSSKGGRNFKSEKIGDYSYSKDGGDKTSYRLRYEEILRQWNTEQPTTGQEHDDVDDMPGQFMLDQQDVVKFE